MKKIFPVLFFILTVTLNACSKETSPAGNPQTVKGKISGKVTDIAGKPLANIRIVLEHTVWHATYIYAVTNADGYYAVILPVDPAVSWTAKAQIKATAYGQEYLFDLEPNSMTTFTANETTVRNFKWKLSGEKSTGGYYGAHVDVYQWGIDVPMTQIKLLFTPLDTSIADGSPALVIERKVEDVAGTFMVKDIPKGKYKIRAIYQGKVLLMDNRHDNEEPAIEKIFVFGKIGYLAETEYNIEFWITE